MLEHIRTRQNTTLLRHFSAEEPSAASTAELMKMVEDLRLQLAQAREQETRTRMEHVSLMSRFTHQPTDFTIETFKTILSDITSWSTQLTDIATADLNNLIGNEEYKEIIRDKITTAASKRQETLDKLTLILTPHKA